ncbi:hypothetical protein LOK49_LG10G01391 [Camellia lanceoleosa]|uniref:Uncharacterized protein n=1 Tax=Camellia lanceoleosa TaxID=1840588 RepID=A0ACC0GC15_9ERIC|nr:hypothetical protein LOK49_LG10G01391 [Camellia lanceoleosa]
MINAIVVVDIIASEIWFGPQCYAFIEMLGTPAFRYFGFLDDLPERGFDKSKSDCYAAKFQHNKEKRKEKKWAVRILAKSPTFARNPRHIQFEADINCLFLYTSYNRLGRNADESDAEAIIDMAAKASLADQQKQVQENIHSQIKSFCASMDEILLPDSKSINESSESTSQRNTAVTRVALALLLEG